MMEVLAWSLLIGFTGAAGLLALASVLLCLGLGSGIVFRAVRAWLRSRAS